MKTKIIKILDTIWTYSDIGGLMINELFPTEKTNNNNCDDDYDIFKNEVTYETSMYDIYNKKRKQQKL